MSRTTFYLSEEDTTEFYRLIRLESELYKITAANLDHQWYLLAREMLDLAWKCAPSHVFSTLLTGSSTPF